MGEVPGDWKKSKEEELGNCCPNSLTSMEMERLTQEAISRGMKDKKVIRRRQCGFAKGKSSISNLISFYCEVTTCTLSTQLIQTSEECL